MNIELKPLIHQIQSYFNPIQGFIESTLVLSDAYIYANSDA
jgi:hypothetical protein